jgi:hypothetical protein
MTTGVLMDGLTGVGISTRGLGALIDNMAQENPRSATPRDLVKVSYARVERVECRYRQSPGPDVWLSLGGFPSINWQRGAWALGPTWKLEPEPTTEVRATVTPWGPLASGVGSAEVRVLSTHYQVHASVV